MKLIMEKPVSIQFSGCGKKKKRDFSATKIVAAVFGKFFCSINNYMHLVF